MLTGLRPLVSSKFREFVMVLVKLRLVVPHLDLNLIYFNLLTSPDSLNSYYKVKVII
jgi:hypothetical protein